MKGIHKDKALLKHLLINRNLNGESDPILMLYPDILHCSATQNRTLRYNDMILNTEKGKKRFQRKDLSELINFAQNPFKYIFN